jgi:hypothetical protein
MVFTATANQETTSATTAASTKCHQARSILSENPDNHSFARRKLMGNPITMATSTGPVNSRDKMRTTSTDDEPNTFRMLISFIRRSAAKAASPKSPRHETIIAIPDDQWLDRRVKRAIVKVTYHAMVLCLAKFLKDSVM